MAVSASAAYLELAATPAERAFIIALTFMMIAPFCNGAWIVAGEALNKLLSGGARAVVLNLLMALLLAGTAALIAFG